MKAVIMAGGEGSRLRPLTCERPKPMVPVLNVPVMEHIIYLLKHHGITDIAVTLQYLPDKIKEYFKDGSNFGVNLIYSVENTPLGTAGSVKKIEDFLDDTFLVISGDALTDFNLTKIIDFHYEKQAIATITMTKATNPLEFGIVLTDDSGKITRFLEKPSWSEVFSDTINTGIYVLEPEILKLMQPYQKYDFSKDIFPYLLKNNFSLYGVVSEGYWCDIGNLDQYKRANFDALQGSVKLHSITAPEPEQISLGLGSYISKEAKVSGTLLLGKNCKVHRGAKIKGPAIVGDNCVLDMGAVIEECLIWDEVYIGESAHLYYSQIGSHCLIKEHVRIKENSFVGDHSVLEEGCQVNSATKVWPHKLIPRGITVSGNVLDSKTAGFPLFKAYGTISGIANYEVRPELVVKIGAAFGSFLKINSTVILSRDSNQYSNLLQKALEAGLQSTGIRLVDLGKNSISLNSFSITNIGAQGGIHIYAAHANPNLITMVFLDEQGIEISKTMETELELLLSKEQFRRISGTEIPSTQTPKQLSMAYTNKLLSLIDTARIATSSLRVRVGINYASSFSTEILDTIFSKLNCEIVALNFTRLDHKAIETIVRSDCDFAILADEVHQNIRLVTKKGVILSSDTIQALYCLLSLKGSLSYSTKNRREEQQNIVSTIRTSHNLENFCSSLGGELLRTKTDIRTLKETCLRQGSVLGGDTRSGFIFPQLSNSPDVLLATIKLIEFLILQNSTLDTVLDILPAMELFEATIDCTATSKGAFMSRLLEEVKDKKVELFEGVKVFNNNAWFLVLPDPHQPLVHVYGECESLVEQDFLQESLTMVKRIAKETNTG